MAPYIPPKFIVQIYAFSLKKIRKSVDYSVYSISTPENTEPHIKGSELIHFVLGRYNVI